MRLSIDVETHDPYLNTHGPGSVRPDDGSRLLCVAVHAEGWDEAKVFRPNNHAEMGELYDLIHQCHTIVGSSIPYDLDWLINSQKIRAIYGKQIHDVALAESLLSLDSTSLDKMLAKYLGLGKEKSLLEEWAVKNELKGDFRQHLAQAPWPLLEDYAKGDVIYLQTLLDMLIDLLDDHGLVEVYDLERRLLPINTKMREAGVRVSEESRFAAFRDLYPELNDLHTKVVDDLGYINFNSSQQKGKAFMALGIEVPFTDKGNPSVTGDWLSANAGVHPAIGNLAEYLKMNTTIDRFINGQLLPFGEEKVAANGKITFPGQAIDGRLHTSFRSYKSRHGGTLTGRYASANPNLQNVQSPERYPVLGAACRRAFIPEEDCFWAKLDYSQIEYRVLGEYAAKAGCGDIVLRTYIDDPEADYHELIATLTGLKRVEAKTCNFSLAYGMGVAALAKKYGWDYTTAVETVTTFHERAPHLRLLASVLEEAAAENGYVRGYLGRKYWRPQDGRDYAITNYLIQGTAAYVLKQAIVALEERGLLYSSHSTLHLTVHDELDFSIKFGKQGEEVLREIAHVMSNSHQLEVPVVTDIGTGPNWAELEKWVA